MNWYKCSDGTKVPKSLVDRNIRDAKAKKLELFLEEHGYYFCQMCERSDCLPITCSHIESVDSCQKNGHTEKSWDLDNIWLLGLKCHAKYDSNYIMNPKL